MFQMNGPIVSVAEVQHDHSISSHLSFKCALGFETEVSFFQTE
jgi:hypothetical protein